MKLKNKYFSISDAAKLKGFSGDHLRRLILDGQLKAEKVGNSWLIAQKDLDSLKRRRAPNKE